jgi:predicted DNA-binding protein (MmcQ/YjbR family)
MDIEALRKHCLQFPHTAENVQWGYDLCFKVDGKLFAVTPLEPAPVRLSFKCSAENFAELCERPGVRPAPYMARAQWVALEQLNTLPDSELRDLLAESYRLVWERLPKKRQAELQGGAGSNLKKHAAKKSVAKKRVARKYAPTKSGGRKSATKTKSSKAGRR